MARNQKAIDLTRAKNAVNKSKFSQKQFFNLPMDQALAVKGMGIRGYMALLEDYTRRTRRGETNED